MKSFFETLPLWLPQTDASKALALFGIYVLCLLIIFCGIFALVSWLERVAMRYYLDRRKKRKNKGSG